MVGPGIGKSRFAATLFAKMKELNFNVELVTEFAKDCVYEKQFELLKTDQLFVLANQNRRLQRLETSNENIQYAINDSPLLLSKIFANINNVPHNFISFNDFVVDLFQSYDNINIVLKRDQSKFNPSGRIQTLQESVQIDQLIIKELNFWKIPYILVDSDDINSVLNLF